MRKRELEQLIFDWERTVDECLRGRIKDLDELIAVRKELGNALQFITSVKPFVDPDIYNQLIEKCFHSQ